MVVWPLVSVVKVFEAVVFAVAKDPNEKVGCEEVADCPNKAGAAEVLTSVFVVVFKDPNVLNIWGSFVCGAVCVSVVGVPKLNVGVEEVTVSEVGVPKVNGFVTAVGMLPVTGNAAVDKANVELEVAVTAVDAGTTDAEVVVVVGFAVFVKPKLNPSTTAVEVGGCVVEVVIGCCKLLGAVDVNSVEFVCSPLLEDVVVEVVTDFEINENPVFSSAGFAIRLLTVVVAELLGSGKATDVIVLFVDGKVSEDLVVETIDSALLVTGFCSVCFGTTASTSSSSSNSPLSPLNIKANFDFFFFSIRSVPPDDMELLFLGLTNCIPHKSPSSFISGVVSLTVGSSS